MSRIGLFAGLVLLLLAGPAHAITRDEVMTRARTYAFHPWQSSAGNMTASCSAAYTSMYQPGDQLGVAYDWGGYMTLPQFDAQIAAGLGAGSLESDGVLACTVGVDCSGFVSQAWDTAHHTTSDLDTISSEIQRTDLLAGDVLNMAGYHVAIFDRLLASGEPAFIEAIGYNVHTNVTEGWSHVDGYVPRRFTTISGTSAADPAGTATDPVVVGSFPFADVRNTQTSTSRLMDSCVLAPSTDESGAEFVYKMTFTQPGQLVVSVSDDASTDIDVELFTELNATACTARADATFTKPVDCGTYYVVADTFHGKAGAYNLTMAFTPTAAQACGTGDPLFAPKGAMGDACSYPGNTALPYCNANLGADTCVYDSNESYCSKPCAANPDCSDMPGGGCCVALGASGSELYCVRGDSCGGGGGGPADAGVSVVDAASNGGGPTTNDAGATHGERDGSVSPPGDGPSQGTDEPATPGDAPSAGLAPSDPVKIPPSAGCSAGASEPSDGAWLAVGALALLTGRARSRRRLPR